MNKKSQKESGEGKNQPTVYGDPSYSAGEDIYSKGKKQPIDESGEEAGPTPAAHGNSPTGEDLDVPGAELDDKEELIGEEDEENNYYSLGGDDHDDLEEDKGD